MYLEQIKLLLVTSLLSVLFLTLVFHHLSVSADEEEVGIQLRDVRYMKFHWHKSFSTPVIGNWKETVMFKSRYKGSQLWGSPVVFFSLFSVVVLNMHQKGVLPSVPVCYTLCCRPPFTAASGHSPNWPPFLVGVLTIFYLCRNYCDLWCGNTHRNKKRMSKIVTK